MNRRTFLQAAGSAFATAGFGHGCVVSTQSADRNDGRLTARPRTGATTTLKSGPLGWGGARDGVIQMPSAPVDGRLPLLVMLHGATQNGSSMIRRVGSLADRMGIVLVAPDSRATTWDAIAGRFGEDVTYLNRVLEFVFERVDVDPSRTALGGFSDGASYALSLGLANGDLFPRVVACSPGFVMPAPSVGRARFFVSHGTSDQVLPIDECSRVIVPRLRQMGYDVTYREFDGRHELPPDIATAALAWMSAP
jgi:phospholipase/carboxylesterase